MESIKQCCHGPAWLCYELWLGVCAVFDWNWNFRFFRRPAPRGKLNLL